MIGLGENVLIPYAHVVLAIVPFKGLDGAKTRLAAVLSAERVLAACRGAACIGQTLLVTPAPGFAPRGVEVLVDSGAGHAEAIALAFADARARRGALVVMADCPLVDSPSLDALARAAAPLALAPARDGGVNALALQAGSFFVPRFGVPVDEMVATARAAGLEPTLVEDPALALDLDRPEDYELALARL
jgi:2-phospho-L-lactate guanylyltransferase (CobY/MobA/RfbA family)